MSTSSRTNLAVLIYEQTFTNCVCFCYRKNRKNLQQPRNGTSDAVIKHDVQEWFKFGVKYDGGHQRQTVACSRAFAPPPAKPNANDHIINAMQTMA